MKFSIVTPCFNSARFLPAMAQSILSQRGDFGLEWIVMDGGSTDGSLDLLRAINDPRLLLVSESDRGQSHALNKGLARATGEVVAWLNADDLYAPGALQAVADAFGANPAARWLTGRCEIIDETGRAIRGRITRYKERSLRRYSYRKLLRENFISQPAVFWRRAALSETPLLDESLHYAMDYDLWLRLGKNSDVPHFLDRVVAQFRLYRQSKTGAGKREQFDEQYQVACRYLENDRMSRAIHRMNVEKIVWAYRMMRWLGR